MHPTQPSANQPPALAASHSRPARPPAISLQLSLTHSSVSLTHPTSAAALPAALAPPAASHCLMPEWVYRPQSLTGGAHRSLPAASQRASVTEAHRCTAYSPSALLPGCTSLCVQCQTCRVADADGCLSCISHAGLGLRQHHHAPSTRTLERAKQACTEQACSAGQSCCMLSPHAEWVLRCTRIMYGVCVGGSEVYVGVCLYNVGETALPMKMLP